LEGNRVSEGETQPEDGEAPNGKKGVRVGVVPLTE
jgi:hypothetical protein